MRAILYNTRSRRIEIPQEERPSQPKSSVPRRRAAFLTIACDGMFLMVVVGAALVFRALVMALLPGAVDSFEKVAVEWLPVVVLVGSWMWFLGLDAVRCLHPAKFLPFEYTQRVVQHIYLQRMEISLWTLASSLILLTLCMLFVETALVSKLFLSGVVALVVLAIRKSIPAGRLSFALATGVFFATMVAIAMTRFLVA